MLTIDGSYGEGGGQVLRSALSLSLITGRPFHAYNIRGGRKRPGLLNQHLTAVRAAKEIGRAQTKGDELGSRELEFRPAGLSPGDFTFSISTAGSVTLVLQTVLVPLLLAEGPSSLVLEGGTHNPAAPPYDFLDRAYLPLMCRMGADIELFLERPGFFPAGGGRMHVRIRPTARLARLDLVERGPIRRCTAKALVSRLPRHVGERELRVIHQELSLNAADAKLEIVGNSPGPGNFVAIEVESENVSELFSGFGRRGVRAETVATRAVKEVQAYLESGVPVGPYLADQILLPLALGGGGRFVTMPLSEHASTNIEIIRRFLEITVSQDPRESAVLVEIGETA